MAEILVSVAIGAAVNLVVGGVSGIIANEKARKAKKDPSPAADAPAFDLALNPNPLPGGPLIGLFGHRRISGRIVFQGKSGKVTHLVYMLCGAPVTSINGVAVNNELVTLNASGYVTDAPWAKSGVFSIQVKLYTGTQTTVSPELTAAFPGWTADFVGKQIAYAHVAIDPSTDPSFADVFQSGIPDFTFDVSGFKCYDPRDGAHNIADPSTWSYSDNVAIVAGNYLIHRLGANLPTSLVDWATVTTAANVCDEAMTLKNGATEARYTCAVFWTTDQRHEDVLQGLEDAMAGDIIPPSDKFKVMAGAYVAPTVTVTQDDYLGEGLSWSDDVPIENLANGVRGVFLSPIHNYEQRDFPAYQDAAALALDGGSEQWLDVRLDYVTGHTQAQRVARIAYHRNRKAAIAQLSARINLFDVVAGDRISLTDTLCGFSAATFRVAADEVSGEMGVNLALVRDEASYYAWTAASDEADFPATDPVLGEVGTLQPPGFALVDTTVGGAINAGLYLWLSPSAGYDEIHWREGGAAFNIETLPLTNPTVGSARNSVTTIPAWEVFAKNSATGAISVSAIIDPPGTYSQIADKVHTDTPFYVLPAAGKPRLLAAYGGAAQIRVPLADGVRSTHIQLWENTVNDIGTATFVQTGTNAGLGATFSVSGTRGTTKFYWARVRNTTDIINGPFSKPLLVVF